MVDDVQVQCIHSKTFGSFMNCVMLNSLVVIKKRTFLTIDTLTTYIYAETMYAFTLVKLVTQLPAQTKWPISQYVTMHPSMPPKTFDHTFTVH